MATEHLDSVDMMTISHISNISLL